MQNTKSVTQINLWSCSPLNIVDIENSHFYYAQKKGKQSLNILIKINTSTCINVDNI